MGEEKQCQVRRSTRGTNKWYWELWEPDLSSMREPVRFSQQIYMCTFEPVLITGSRSGENLRSVFSLVLAFKSDNGFALWEPGWEPGQHWRTAKHWSLCGRKRPSSYSNLLFVVCWLAPNATYTLGWTSTYISALLKILNLFRLFRFIFSITSEG